MEPEQAELFQLAREVGVLQRLRCAQPLLRVGIDQSLQQAQRLLLDLELDVLVVDLALAIRVNDFAGVLGSEEGPLGQSI